MENIQQKEDLLWWREKHMQVLLIALMAYKFEKNKEMKKKFYDFASYFGKQSEMYRIKLDNLS